MVAIPNIFKNNKHINGNALFCLLISKCFTKLVINLTTLPFVLLQPYFFFNIENFSLFSITDQGPQVRINMHTYTPQNINNILDSIFFGTQKDKCSKEQLRRNISNSEKLNLLSPFTLPI